MGPVTTLLILVGPLFLIVTATALGILLVVVKLGMMDVMELLRQSRSEGKGWDKRPGESTSIVGILCSAGSIDGDNPMSIIPSVADSMINSLDVRVSDIRCCN
jgi:hypothetical protein